jgi:hypothetical protein
MLQPATGLPSAATRTIPSGKDVVADAHAASTRSVANASRTAAAKASRTNRALARVSGRPRRPPAAVSALQTELPSCSPAQSPSAMAGDDLPPNVHYAQWTSVEWGTCSRCSPRRLLRRPGRLARWKWRTYSRCSLSVEQENPVCSPADPQRWPALPTMTKLFLSFNTTVPHISKSYLQISV